MIRCIIFDCGNTLFTERYALKSLGRIHRGTLGKFGFVISTSKLSKITNIILKKHASEIREAKLPERVFCRELLKRLDARIRLEEYVAEFNVSYWKKIKIFPDVRTVLERLSKKYRLAALCNGKNPTAHHFILKNLKLEKYFEVSGHSEEIGFEKPDRNAFLFVTNVLNVKPEECAMVGDNLNDDVMGAKRVGMTTFWLDRERKNASNQPNFVIHSLMQIEKILDEVRAI